MSSAEFGNPPGGRLSRAPLRPAATGWVVWVSLASACLGWMFDAMDLQIFTLILVPSVRDLIGSSDPGLVAYTGGCILASKLVAWGLGGVAFGVITDRIGRAKTMMITIVIYSTFTGLSGLAHTWWELALLQALAGVGIGGEWAAGAALVAEIWPERTRARALLAMQMSFAFGVFAAALVNLILGPIGWRFVLAAGATPALLTLVIRRYVPEPDRWLAIRDRRPLREYRGVVDANVRTFLSIFAPGVRGRTLVGVLIALTMMIGSWGALSLLPTWIHQLLGPDRSGLAVTITSQCFILISVGAVFGYLTLIWLTDAIGRRWSYFVVIVGSAAANLFTFTHVKSIDELQWVVLIYGFFAVGGYGALAVYLSELFPTRIRASGQGFCWNIARIFTAAGPFVSGMLVGVFGSVPSAGSMVAWIYLVGMVAIWFGPETRGTPLQD